MSKQLMPFVLKEDFDGVEVAIIADPLPLAGLERKQDNGTDDGLTTTSSRTIERIEVNVRKVVKSVVKGFGEDMASIHKNLGAVELELEVSLMLAGDIWTFVKTEGHVKIKMTWKNPVI